MFLCVAFEGLKCHNSQNVQIQQNIWLKLGTEEMSILLCLRPTQSIFHVQRMPINNHSNTELFEEILYIL